MIKGIQEIPEGLSPVEYFKTCTQAKLPASILDKLDSYSLEYLGADKLSKTIAEARARDYLVHYNHTSPRQISRDSSSVDRGYRLIYYYLSYREIGELKVLVISRDNSTDSSTDSSTPKRYTAW